MEEIILYKCTYCQTEFRKKSECEKCEHNHKIPQYIKDARYSPYARDFTGLPSRVLINFGDGKEVWYKQD